MTEGERSVALAYVGISVLGAMLAFTVVNQLGGGGSIIRPMSLYDIWSIVAGTLGAPAGLCLGRKWLGHQGIPGLWRAAFALPIVTLFGAICGGTLALPIYGTMFGPFTVFVTLWSYPLLAAFWGANLIGAHFMFATYRRERLSIFADPPDGGIPV